MGDGAHLLELLRKCDILTAARARTAQLTRARRSILTKTPARSALLWFGHFWPDAIDLKGYVTSTGDVALLLLLDES